MNEPMIVVLVHGWSVHSTDTYGKLAQRLKSEGPDAIDVRHIWLSKYVSFRDEVRMEDLSRGFEAALRRELKAEIQAGRKIACIAHSTGGPVIRDWWDRFYVQAGERCPLSHLIMLAPANFGSALAQLGKGRLNQLRSAVKSVAPGQGVLDWLELGSAESWELNRRWICEYADPADGDNPLFLFVLTGQRIDRKFYDHVNSYTGEPGSDGTVRVAAANLNAAYVRLVQQEPVTVDGVDTADTLTPENLKFAAKTAFALLPGRSHTGPDSGILYSIKDDGKSHPTVTAILQCLKVENKSDYDKLADRFAANNQQVHERERLETVRRPIVRDIHYLHDAMSMVILRIRDHRAHTPTSFDFKFTGPRNSPDLLPEGFFQDRQRNSRDAATITYFVNFDKMAGTPEITDAQGRFVIREAFPPLPRLGIQILPRPSDGYVHYLTTSLQATKKMLETILHPDQTILIDIVLRRCVREGIHQLTQDTGPKDFRDQSLGGLIDF
jgi:hypothetical protein